MILIVEPRSPRDDAGAAQQRQHECPLHVTLRRMGFHAARAPAARPPRHAARQAPVPNGR